MNTKPQAEINTLLVAVTPDSNLSTDGTALDGVSGLRGSGIGATSKPILFSTPMVKAILNGRKTQTRRVFKVNKAAITDKEESVFWDIEMGEAVYNSRGGQSWWKCPYGNVGDTLWVRETWWKKPFLTRRDLKDGADTWPYFEYETEKIMAWEDSELKHYGWKKMPSIFMPREACRIELTITNIRTEWLNDISEQDSINEGIEYSNEFGYKLYSEKKDFFSKHLSASDSYMSLWEKINGKDSWKLNPFVWVIEFKKNGVYVRTN